MLSQQEIDARISALAANMRAKGLAWSDSQAKERARDIVMQELKSQEQFEKMKDDPALNPQQRPSHISPETLKQAGGMLSGDEFPKDVPLAEILKGRKAQK
jgi:hypothetical protein